MKTKELTRIAIFAAITACLAQIIIPLPFSPVPVSMGILAVLLTGAILRPKQAFLAELIYILLGAIGMPVFGGFKGGIGALLGPTGGYLFTYPLMAWIIAYCIEKNNTQKVRASFAMILGMVLAMILCYSIGTFWLAFINHITVQQAFLVAVLPFLIPDCMKIGIAILIGIPIRNQVTVNQKVTTEIKEYL